MFSTLDGTFSVLQKVKEIFRVEWPSLRKGKCFEANSVDAWHWGMCMFCMIINDNLVERTHNDMLRLKVCYVCVFIICVVCLASSK